MDIIDFYRREQLRLHSETRQLLTGLSREEWNHVPPGSGNNIAFLVWHSARTEDIILRFILQGRPPIWNEHNWHERMALPPRVQGTGMSTEEAHALHIDDIGVFMTYVEAVWQEYEAYLASITDGGAELSARKVTVKPLGEIPALLAIGQVCISHLFLHLGEMSLLKGMLGKPGLIL